MPSNIASSFVIAITAVMLLPHDTGAQAASQRATVRVHVRHDAAPITRAVVRAGNAATQTDASGNAVLLLASGHYTLVVNRLGFRPDSVRIALRAGQDTTVAVTLEEQAAAVEELIVLATRSERRIEDVPLRVEVLEREEVEEKMLMTPGDISMMMNETGGLRVQTTSPSLGAANVRVHGLRGRYTLMLSDGLPLYGGQSGALGLLQIPPMDLSRVEVIKGVASALYGSSALGGVINLVSRRPGAAPDHELLVNQTTRGGSDAILWASDLVTERWGYTLLGSGHRQDRVDVDGDGWADLPGYRRVVVRPRAFWSGERGRNAFVTVGATLEDREGGTLSGRVSPAGTPFAESLETRRVDAGSVLRYPFGSNMWSVRSSVTTQLHGHVFGAVREDDRHDTWFGETSVAITRGLNTWVAGVALHAERFTSRQVPRFDYLFTIPAAFAQLDVEPLRWLAVSVSGRLDAHSEYGTAFNPRVSLLLRGVKEWTVRVSGGTGVFAPTPFTEETEASGLAPLRALAALGAERARSGSVDVGGKVGPLEINATAFASAISFALLVRPAAGSTGELEMVNARLPTRTSGTDVMLRFRTEDVTTTISYTYIESSEQADDATRQPVPLTPRHTAGLVSVWEREGSHRVGLEAYYTGVQNLADNPYMDTSRPYVVFGAIAEKRAGRARLFINLENVGGVRMTRYQPLVRPTRGEGGRWTTDAWGPLEGRTINAGVRWNFGAPRDDE